MSERGETSPEGATLPVGVAAALALARHDPARGEAHLRQVLASRPDDNEIRWILARYLHDVRRDSAAAEVEYLALIARAPER